MKEKLKPCPFCGGEARVYESNEGSDGLQEIWIISCDICPAEMRGDRVEIPSTPTAKKGDTYIVFNTGLRKEYTDEEIQYLNVDRFGKDEKEDLIKAWNKRV